MTIDSVKSQPTSELLYDLKTSNWEPKKRLLQDVEAFFERHECKIRWSRNKLRANEILERRPFWYDWFNSPWSHPISKVFHFLQFVQIKSSGFLLETPEASYDVEGLPSFFAMMRDPQLAKLLDTPIDSLKRDADQAVDASCSLREELTEEQRDQVVKEPQLTTEGKLSLQEQRDEETTEEATLSNFQDPSLYDWTTNSRYPKLRLLRDVAAIFQQNGCWIRYNDEIVDICIVFQWPTTWVLVQDFLKWFVSTCPSTSCISVSRDKDHYYQGISRLQFEQLLDDPLYAKILNTPISSLPAILEKDELGPRNPTLVPKSGSSSLGTQTPILREFASLKEEYILRKRSRVTALEVFDRLLEAEKYSCGKLQFFEKPLAELIPQPSIETLPDRFEQLAMVTTENAIKNWTPALMLRDVAKSYISATATIADHAIIPDYVDGLIRANPGLSNPDWNTAVQYLSPARLHHQFETTRAIDTNGLVLELLSRDPPKSIALRERLLEHILKSYKTSS